MNSFPLPRITLRWDNTPSAALRLHSASNLRPIPYPLPNKSRGYSSSTKASKQTSLRFAFAALLQHRSGYDDASENYSNLLCLQLLLRRLKTYFPCWRESFLKVYKMLDRSPSSGKVLSSCAPKEVDMDDKEVVTNKFVIDCGTSQQCVVGGIVALGKFDALHVGHRELAVQASKTGIPFLLSFVGIAEVLGFESRPPIVANCDRKRVLSSWAPFCGNVVPLEYHIDFSSVRYLTPRQFVERLSKELGVAGVVAGANYRFGYKAAGDAKDLVRLCEEYGLSAYIVSPVMDKTHRGSQNGASVSTSSSDLGQVSSTRIRAALAVRDMGYVAELLGRKHRLVLAPMNEEFRVEGNTIIAPKSSLLNQPPGDGEFSNCTLLLDGVSVGLARVAIDSMRIRIEPDCGKQAAELVEGGGVIGIEF